MRGPTPSAVSQSPFVGREIPLRTLVSAVEAALAGAGVLGLVAGEPGIGKTRLVAEVAAGVSAQVLWASCWEGAGAPAYWPWLQLLRGLPPGEDADRLTAALEHGREGPDGTAGPDTGEGARFRLFDDVARVLAAAARRHSLLLVIDDLQWADEASLQLLQLVSGDPRARHLAILATYRDTDLDAAHPLARRLGDLVRGGVHVALDGLDSRDVAALVRALRGGQGPPQRDVGLLHRRTGGNPLFLRELVRLLDEEGPSVPASVRAVVATRLARLSPPTQQVLAAAAVLGAGFEPAVLASVADCPESQLLAALDEAVAARLVHPRDDRLGFAFAHALVREVLYEGLGLAARTPLHRRAAEVLEARGSQGRLPEIAHHLLECARGGQDAERAVDYALRAGAHHLDILAYEESAAWLRRALDILGAERADDPRRGELLLRMGEAALAAGDVAQARDAYRQAADLARGAGDAELLAHAALGLGAGFGGFEVQLFDPLQIDLLEEALRVLAPQPSRLRAWVLARLSVAVSFLDSEDRRRSLSEEAVAVARAVADPGALGYALAAHGDAIPGPDFCETRLEEAGEVVRLGQETGDRRLELLGRRLRFVALLETGEVGEADRELERFAQGAERLRQPLYRWYVPLWRGMRALLRGELDEAARRCAEAEEIGARADSFNALVLTFTQWWVRRRCEGRFAEAGEAMSALLEQHAGPQVTAGPRAVAAVQVGDHDKARTLLGQWLADGLHERVRDSEWLPESAQLAEAAVLVGAREAAEVLATQMRPYAHRFCVEGIGAALTGSVAWYLALLARFLGDAAGAQAYAAQARAAHHRIGLVGNPPPLAGAQPPLPAAAPGAPPAALRREGATWAVTWAGRTARLRDSKGVGDLAVLLARPGREVHCLELMGGADVGPEAGPALDQQARRAYERRIRDLHQDIDEARDANDPARAERAEVELDALVQQLSEAFGLAGRSRPSGSAAERARSAVGWRIRAALRGVAEVHPDLARHLSNAVRTGTWCSYRPETAVVWAIDEGQGRRAP